MMEEQRKKIHRRWESLKTERTSWISHWREISENILPRNGRFIDDDSNDGRKKHNKIYDNTPIRALKILSAGLMGGLTSPSRPWFKLAMHNDEMNQYHEVKEWLSKVESMMLSVFQRSNIYGSLHSMYEELAAFGTAACIILPDYEDVIRCYPLTIGEYAVATNWRGEIDTIYREFEKTVGETVEEFGIENVSDATRQNYEDGKYDAKVKIIHAIEPRRDRDLTRKDSKNMPYKSVYIETGAEEGKILRESGFLRFPAVCPRWDITDNNVYGNSPAMTALGDIKQLQFNQTSKLKGIDYQVNPPIIAPTDMKTQSAGFLPGGILYHDSNGTGDTIRSAFDVRIDLNHLLEDIADVRQRVQSAFYADLFLMVSQQSQNMTATEVAERHEEKMLMLGPVLERLQNELIDPLIEITFDAMVRAGILPPPPDAIADQDINVVLVSILAQAQRAIGVNSIDRFVGALASVAQVKPEVLDNFNGDKWAEIYADSLGIDPRILMNPEEVAAIRQQRMEQQTQAQQLHQMEQGAGIAKSLAQAQSLSDDEY